MTTAVREAPHHNGLTCIKNYGCKRAECRRRGREYDRRRYRQVGYGTWRSLVDAAPVREHIAALREAGNSIPDIQRLASVGAATLSRILYDSPQNPRAQRIRHEVADRILAVEIAPPPTKPHQLVDGLGTRRRLQALISMGWTLNALGPLLGFHPRRLTDLLHGDRVFVSTARRIAEGYRVVQTWDPAAHGVPQSSRTMSRNLAAREGWYGPLAWDNIDDPDAKPEKADAYTPVSKYGRDTMRMLEIEHLYLLGESPASMARQLDGNEKYVRDLLAVVIRRREARAEQERRMARLQRAAKGLAA